MTNGDSYRQKTYKTQYLNGRTEKFLSEEDLSHDQLTMIIMMFFYVLSHI